MILQLHLTPREAERLRNVSYQRQLEAGMKNPGSAGLTGLGDCAPWVPSKGHQDGIPLESPAMTETNV
jgi:hypothetical protein